MDRVRYSPSFEIKSVNLHFNLHEIATVITAKSLFKKINNEDLILNGVGLKLISIFLSVLFYNTNFSFK